MEKLTEKQRKFIKYYVLFGNGTKAAIKAGYSPDCATETASEILTYPHVIKGIEKERETLNVSYEHIRGTVIEKTLHALDQVPKDKFGWSHYLKALELTAKISGMDNVRSATSDQGTSNILTPELCRVIAEFRSKKPDSDSKN